MPGVLKNFLRLFKPLRRQDAVFGSMLYMQGMDYWETKTYFAPLQSTIEIFVDGSEDDDLAIQQQFFQEISANWNLVIEHARNAVRKALKNDPDLVVDDDIERLTPSFSVPKSKFADAEWTLTLSNEYETFLAEISMKGVNALEAHLEQCG